MSSPIILQANFSHMIFPFLVFCFIVLLRVFYLIFGCGFLAAERIDSAPECACRVGPLECDGCSLAGTRACVSVLLTCISSSFPPFGCMHRLSRLTMILTSAFDLCFTFRRWTGFATAVSPRRHLTARPQQPARSSSSSCI